MRRWRSWSIYVFFLFIGVELVFFFFIDRYRNAFVDYQLVLRIDSKVDKVQESMSRYATWPHPSNYYFSFILCVYVVVLSLFHRITRLLRDLDGGNWREKLPPNPDAERVISALSATSAVSPPLTANLAPPTSETNNARMDTPLDNADNKDKGQEKAAPPPVPPDVPPETSGGPSSILSDEELFDEFKSKGNEFVKQV